MNIFKRLSDRSDRQEYVQALFSSLEVGTQHINTRALDFLSSNPSRFEILDEIINNCHPATSPMLRYYLAMADYYYGSLRRQDAIKDINKYLKAGIWEGAYNHIDPPRIYNEYISPRDYHKYFMLIALANSYYKEHMNIEALTTALNCISLLPCLTPAYCIATDAYIRLNRLKDAEALLKSAEKTKYYKVFYTSIGTKDDTFIKIISRELNRVQSMIEKGYVYKPRAKKTQPEK